MTGFDCASCGKHHDTLPRDLAYQHPATYFSVAAADREERVRVNDDLCMIDEGDSNACFVRGVLTLPIRGSDEQFRWGVWAQVAMPDFERYVDAWENDSEDSLPHSRDGWTAASNRIPTRTDWTSR